jgi:hypothetical protein
LPHHASILHRLATRLRVDARRCKHARGKIGGHGNGERVGKAALERLRLRERASAVRAAGRVRAHACVERVRIGAEAALELSAIHAPPPCRRRRAVP